MLSNLKFTLTGTLTTSGTSVTVSNDLERDQVITQSNVSVVLKNTTGNIIERLICNFATGTMTVVKRGLDQSESEVEVSALKKEWRPGTQGYITVLAFDILDTSSTGAKTLAGAYAFTGNNTHSGTEGFTNKITVSGANSEIDMTGAKKPLSVPNLTTAERTALTGKNGDIVYDTNLGVFYQYKSTGRASIDTGTPTPNASETVVGSVEIATTSEFNAGTDIGGTGAYLSPKNSDIQAMKTSLETQIDTVDNLANADYPAGENITAGQTVFVETGPTFAVATNEASIGYDASTTRFSLPIIGNGVGFTTFKLGLKKFGSPAVDLGVRIETDNAGSPSGTLIDANATSTVATSGLTTSLVDTTITLSGSPNTNTHGGTLSTTSSQTNYRGFKVELLNQTGLVSVTKNASCTATTCYLYNSSYTLLTSVSFSGNTATFNYNGLTDGSIYYILVGSGGSSYTSITGSGSFPYTLTDIEYKKGFYGFGDFGGQKNETNTYILSSTGGETTSNGYKIYVNTTTNIISVNKNSSCTATRVILKDNGGSTITTATFSGNTATFSSPQLLTAGNYYRVEVDSNGSSYTFIRTSSTVTPYISNRVTYSAWSFNGSDFGVFYGVNIDYITTDCTGTEDTNLYDITSISTNKNSLIPDGTKAHIVLFGGTYGAETVNGTNYFGVGYSTNDTTTRGYKTYNGSSYSDNITKNKVTDSSGFPYLTSSGITGKGGFRLQALKGQIVTKINKNTGCNATTFYVLTDGGTQLATGSFSGDVGILSIPVYFRINEYYRIELDSGGSNYTSKQTISATFPVVGTNISYITGSLNGSDSTTAYNIDSIITIEGGFRVLPYLSCAGAYSQLLSLTDSDYSYKVDMRGISKETVAIGTKPKVTIDGINSNQTGLTYNYDYYLGATPGSISTTPGAFKYKVGKAISTTKIYIDKGYYYDNQKELTFLPGVTYSGAGTISSGTSSGFVLSLTNNDKSQTIYSSKLGDSYNYMNWSVVSVIDISFKILWGSSASGQSLYIGIGDSSSFASNNLRKIFIKHTYTDNLVALLSGNGSASSTSSTIAVTYNTTNSYRILFKAGEYAKLYINDLEVISKTTNLPALPSANSILFGCWNDGGTSATINVSDAKIKVMFN